MALRSFQAILLAFALLLSIGNPAYTLEIDQDETGNRWYFRLYADGFKEVDGFRDLVPIDSFIVNKKSKRLEVVGALNGRDPTVPRLKMREVMKECWILAGLAPSDLQEIVGWSAVNENIIEAIAKCRDGMHLEGTDSFIVSDTETAEDRKDCWDTLGTTIFSSSIKGAIKDFDIGKELVGINVVPTDTPGVDHVIYKFSAAHST
ncbi:hypothetical protein DHEL01_v211798 [Diaporthe helianthi]|uniref:Uncharacterized protein n=1 Tax=Diaporthe helianthi TaxID=158607 RepID=A0A2P5HHT3_DIAHE|nr:hypothetical protein DHEL01_v211798 [Diaporthe helianthi]